MRVNPETDRGSPHPVVGEGGAAIRAAGGATRIRRILLYARGRGFRCRADWRTSCATPWRSASRVPRARSSRGSPSASSAWVPSAGPAGRRIASTQVRNSPGRAPGGTGADGSAHPEALGGAGVSEEELRPRHRPRKVSPCQWTTSSNALGIPWARRSGRPRLENPMHRTDRPTVPGRLRRTRAPAAAARSWDSEADLPTEGRSAASRRARSSATSSARKGNGRPRRPPSLRPSPPPGAPPRRPAQMARRRLPDHEAGGLQRGLDRANPLLRGTWSRATTLQRHLTSPPTSP